MTHIRTNIVNFGLQDIAPVLNLILDGSAHGHFNPDYVKPPFIAGLGLQLFSLLFGRIKMPDGIWYSASARVLRVDRHTVGYAMVRRENNHSGEIYMLAVQREYRSLGY